MLGWEVRVYCRGEADPGNLIAHWQHGSRVVDWIVRLARHGLARDCGGTGYPWIFTVKAEVFIPILKSVNHSQRVLDQLGETLLPPPGLDSDVVLNRPLLKACTGTEDLLVHAWDLS